MGEQTPRQDLAEDRRRHAEYQEKVKKLRETGWEPYVKHGTDGTFFTLDPKFPEGTLALMVSIQSDEDDGTGLPNNEYWCKIGGIGKVPEIPDGVEVGQFTNTYAVQDGKWVNTKKPEYRNHAD